MVEKSITGIVTWLKNWFYDADQVDTFLNNKVNKNLGTAGMNVVTDGSGDIALEAKPTIPTVPSASTTTPSADANSGSYGSGTTWARADHVHPKSSIYAEASHDHTVSNITDFPSIPSKTSDLTNDGADGTNVFVADNDSRLSDARTPTSHNHRYIANDGTFSQSSASIGDFGEGDYIVFVDTDDENNPRTIKRTSSILATYVKDSNAYSPINVAQNNSQQEINTAIVSKISSLQSTISSLSGIKAVEVVTTRPSASSSTMGKLYIVSENSKVNVYYTERSGSSSNYTYSWHKMDTDILDELSIAWSDIQNNPFSSASPSDYATSEHTHGNLTNDGKVGTNANYFVYTTTGGAITSKQKIGNITTGGAIGSDSGKIITTTTSGVLQASDSITSDKVTDNGTSLSTVLSGKGSVGDDIDWSYNSNGFVNGIKLHDKTSSGDDATGTITFHLKS